jgi:hypothetical protein
MAQLPESESAAMQALERGLRRHAGWLRQAGLVPVDSRWPELRLASEHAGERHRWHVEVP